MKKYFFTLIIVFLLANVAVLSAQTHHIATLDVIETGFFARSRMMLTHPDGTVEVTKIENRYNLVGITFDNVKINQQMVAEEVKRLQGEGYVMMETTTYTYGIIIWTRRFVTRYTFRKVTQ